VTFTGSLEVCAEEPLPPASLICDAVTLAELASRATDAPAVWMVAVLALGYWVFGKIRISSGRSGKKVKRFARDLAKPAQVLDGMAPHARRPLHERKQIRNGMELPLRPSGRHSRILLHSEKTL